MKSGNHPLQGTVVSNKAHPYSMLKFPMKYCNWQATMASGRKICDFKMKRIKINVYYQYYYLKGTMVSNKIRELLMESVQIKYDE